MGLRGGNVVGTGGCHKCRRWPCFCEPAATICGVRPNPGEPTFPLKECPENHIQLINVMFSTQEIIYYLAASFIYKSNRSQKSQRSYFFIMSMTFLFRLCFLEAICLGQRKQIFSPCINFTFTSELKRGNIQSPQGIQSDIVPCYSFSLRLLH